jgi:hypothetical protein
MRSYDPNDDYDEKEAKALLAEEWMLLALGLNPDYVLWGPGDDYMHGDGEGWNSAMRYDSWREFDITLDDLNEVVNFYFQITREAKDCGACGATGLSPKARKISDSFYGSSEEGGWRDKITLDECKALVERGRLMEWDARAESWKKREVVDEAFLREVNTANGSGRSLLSGRAHDAINRFILIETRCKRLGIVAACDKCKGEGSIFIEDRARLGLVLWLLHPRKGASRGVEIASIEKRDLPKALAFLKRAAERNTARFSKAIVAAGEMS